MFYQPFHPCRNRFDPAPLEYAHDARPNPPTSACGISYTPLEPPQACRRPMSSTAFSVSWKRSLVP